MRVEDYRFYGQLCLILGLILVLIGVALPVLATIVYRGWSAGSLAALYFGSPLLGSGVIVAIIGIWFILIGQVLYREYRLRRKVRNASMTESQKTTFSNRKMNHGKTCNCCFTSAGIIKKGHCLGAILIATKFSSKVYLSE